MTWLEHTLSLSLDKWKLQLRNPAQNSRYLGLRTEFEPLWPTLDENLNNKAIEICVVSETNLKPEMPDAIVNIVRYNIFRRERKWSGLGCRRKCEIAIFARSNLDLIDCCISEVYELQCLTFVLHSGHLLLREWSVSPAPANIHRSLDFI